MINASWYTVRQKNEWKEKETRKRDQIILTLFLTVVIGKLERNDTFLIFLIFCRCVVVVVVVG